MTLPQSHESYAEMLKDESLSMMTSGSTREAIEAHLRSRIQGLVENEDQATALLNTVAVLLNPHFEAAPQGVDNRKGRETEQGESSQTTQPPTLPASMPSGNNQQMMEMLQRLLPLLAEQGIMAGQPTPVEILNRKVATLEAQLAEAQKGKPVVATEPAPTLGPERTKHNKFPDPPMFSGKRHDYKRFRSQMKHKIQHDGAGMGLGVGYMLLRLEGTAAKVAIAWSERHPTATHDELFTFLDGQYINPHEEEISRRKLQDMRQGPKQTIHEYNTQFMQLVFDAGEEDNLDNIKTKYLTSLRPNLMQHLVSLEFPSDWSIAQIQNRVAKVEENISRANLGVHYQKKKAAPLPEGASGDTMDWEPTTGSRSARVGRGTQRNNGSQKAAMWVSDDVRNHRRSNDLCLRCGKSGHYQPRCTLLPAPRPKTASAVRSASVEDLEEDFQGEIHGDSSSEN
jgi:hypothetical protein